MSFSFFTFNGRFFWEDVYNHNDWVIQLNVRTLKYRLLDPFCIRRESGTFEKCKEALLKYISACEMEDIKTNTVLILHGFAKSKSSVKHLAEGLHDINANIIAISQATLRRGMSFHTNILEQLLQNMEIKGKLYIVTTGASCLTIRKLLADSENYRRYNIERILDINPLNSGSDFAEIIANSRLINLLLGPMLKDITSPAARELKKLPQEIDHGIIFASSPLVRFMKKFFARYESFPSSSFPNEHSYAKKIQNIDAKSLFSLNDENVIKYCKRFITTGDFNKEFQAFSDESKVKNRKKTGSTENKKTKKSAK